MITLTPNNFSEKRDFLIYKVGNINVVFSTAEEDRSFNRHTDYGLENLNSIKEDLNLRDVIYLNQVHSDKSYIYNKDYKNIKDEEGDAIITYEKDVAIGVFTADCVPIIIVNEKSKVVAAIHSGWKGTFNSIVLKTLIKMKKEFKIDIKETKIFIGPHIKQCCYEVSNELKQNFLDKTGIDEKKLFNGRNLSLKECILKDLAEAGIKDNNIYLLDLCTYCENDVKLYSYRKSEGTYGRLFSFVFIE